MPLPEFLWRAHRAAGSLWGGQRQVSLQDFTKRLRMNWAQLLQSRDERLRSWRQWQGPLGHLWAAPRGARGAGPEADRLRGLLHQGWARARAARWPLLRAASGALPRGLGAKALAAATAMGRTRVPGPRALAAAAAATRGPSSWAAAAVLGGAACVAALELAAGPL